MLMWHAMLAYPASLCSRYWCFFGHHRKHTDVSRNITFDVNVFYALQMWVKITCYPLCYSLRLTRHIDVVKALIGVFFNVNMTIAVWHDFVSKTKLEHDACPSCVIENELLIYLVEVHFGAT